MLQFATDVQGVLPSYQGDYLSILQCKRYMVSSKTIVSSVPFLFRGSEEVNSVRNRLEKYVLTIHYRSQHTFKEFCLTQGDYQSIVQFKRYMINGTTIVSAIEFC